MVRLKLNMGKQWKQQGPEDQFVLQLFKDKKINKKTSARELKSRYPLIFGEFSEDVVRNHLTTLKRFEGICEYSFFKNISFLIIFFIQRFRNHSSKSRGNTSRNSPKYRIRSSISSIRRTGYESIKPTTCS